MDERRERRTRRVLIIDLLALALALAGSTSVVLGRSVERAGPPVRVSGVLAQPDMSSSGSAGSDHSPTPSSAASERPAAPAELSIPAIGVDTPLVRLSLNSDGTLDVPADFSLAGWFVLGPRPGEPGPAVIAGHVDSTAGPAVFFRLGQLAPGSVVRVATKDRDVVLFRVYAVREYPKTAFPSSLVYGPTPGPELRLITCGGPFDARTGHYLDNIVVFARYVRTRAATA
jgi:sortase (surface protein transpeptidase)